MAFETYKILPDQKRLVNWKQSNVRKREKRQTHMTDSIQLTMYFEDDQQKMTNWTLSTTD